MADKIKKLSDAIRLGATFHPQCRRTFILLAGGQVFATCALAAALEATGADLRSGVNLDMIQERFPEVPRCKLSVAIGFNDLDQFKWSREAIANWFDEQGY